MLSILHAACATAVDAFRAAENPIDERLLADLESMVERTRLELERLRGGRPVTAFEVGTSTPEANPVAVAVDQR